MPMTTKPPGHERRFALENRTKDHRSRSRGGHGRSRHRRISRPSPDAAGVRALRRARLGCCAAPGGTGASDRCAHRSAAAHRRGRPHPAAAGTCTRPARAAHRPAPAGRCVPRPCASGVQPAVRRRITSTSTASTAASASSPASTSTSTGPGRVAETTCSDCRRAAAATVAARPARFSGEVDAVRAELVVAHVALRREQRLHRLPHRRAVVDPDRGMDHEMEPLELATFEGAVRAVV